ncbi:hypothetical protein H6F43_19420 [Leptolyngbya sp. FACHB-36]|nr:hypothetical protein [Leptolyngbya sp. FACHB-36]MBD2022354.1 hypothetical protein [Leptolyngbya sp. FACHB-36]
MTLGAQDVERSLRFYRERRTWLATIQRQSGRNCFLDGRRCIPYIHEKS